MVNEWLVYYWIDRNFKFTPYDLTRSVKLCKIKIEIVTQLAKMTFDLHEMMSIVDSLGTFPVDRK